MAKAEDDDNTIASKQKAAKAKKDRFERSVTAILEKF